MMRRSYQPLIITLFLASFPFIVLSVKDRREALYELAFAMPYLVAAVIGFLSLKLNQRRIFFLALMLALVYALAEIPTDPWWGLTRTMRVQGLAVALPLSWLALFSLPQKRPLAMGPAYVAAILLPLALVFLPLHFGPEAAAMLLTASGTGLTRGLGIPEVALLATLGLALSTLFIKDRFMRDFRIFASLSLGPVLFALGRAALGGPSAEELRLELACGFLSASTILTYALFRLYWQKVYLDELTGIPNRRALNDRLSLLKDDYAIAMTDIDYFKRFNDTYGHEEGDNVLRFVAKQLDEDSRGNAYRYGGEEICVVLERCSAAQATKILDSMRRALSARNFTIRSPKNVRLQTTEKDRDKQTRRQKETVQVTISVGVAGHGGSLERPEDVLIAADAALYRAKELGRDRVLMAQIGHGRRARI